MILPVAAVLGIAAYIWLRSQPPAADRAYIRSRSVTVWNRVAQVREPVATLRYGDVVELLERRGENARIRTAQGATGWVSERSLMPPELWAKATQLVEQARALPVQARGRTKVLSNLRTEPGRDAPRILQISSDVPVEVVARSVAEWKTSGEEEPSRGAAPPAKKDSGPRREDWVLVRAREEEVGEAAGWVLARFIEPDLPPPLRDLGANIRWMAWFELDRVPAEDGEKPQFLGAGVTGPEGQPCDFTLLRVYTWNPKRHGYETAYVESNFCGRLPVRIAPAGAEVAFRFASQGKTGEEQREYRFRQNIVRRLRAGGR